MTVQATADTTETLWVAHLDDVAPDGASRPLTQGALLGSHRALDPETTWYTADGNVLRPHHISTRAAVEPVVPGELTRYDLDVFPTAALIEPGHRLRLTLTTYDFPHLVPTQPARHALEGAPTGSVRAATRRRACSSRWPSPPRSRRTSRAEIRELSGQPDAPGSHHRAVEPAASNS